MLQHQHICYFIEPADLDILTLIWLCSGLKNPLTLMSYVAPVMAVSTGLFSLILDPWDEFGKSDYFNSSWHIIRSCLLMLFGGSLAFFMVRILVSFLIHFTVPFVFLYSTCSVAFQEFLFFLSFFVFSLVKMSFISSD